MSADVLSITGVCRSSSGFRDCKAFLAQKSVDKNHDVQECEGHCVRSQDHRVLAVSLGSLSAPSSTCEAKVSGSPRRASADVRSHDQHIRPESEQGAGDPQS